jgi:hypothetical protein
MTGYIWSRARRDILGTVRRNTVLAIAALLVVILIMGFLGILQMQRAITP